MQLHQLKVINKKKSRKRVGRGGKKGTYCGKGVKGQNARSGKGTRAGFAGGDTTILKRLPKKRGVVGKVAIKQGSKLSRFKIKFVILNLKDIKDKFKEGETVSPKTLLEKKIISRINKKVPRVKILGEGKLKNKLIFKNIRIAKKLQEELIGKQKIKKEVKKSVKSRDKKKIKPKVKK